MQHYSYITWIPLLSLTSFLLLGLFGRKYLKTVAGLIGTGSLLASAVLAIYAAADYFFINGSHNGAYSQVIGLKWEWLRFSPGVSIDMGILVDPISVMMIVVVTFISLMVHVFSLAYMKGEERYATYYAFLSLFTFSMIGLVLSTNLLQTYIFWELVGISSYLLIGFYFQKPAAVAASAKAFIVTRFADLGFLVGILVLAFQAETLDIPTLIERLTTASPQFTHSVAASFLGISALSWGLGLVFIGGAGKSAMFPLHIWLPDAMEGPTPVSALIHAATMVVAGVYLVARLFPVYSIGSPETLALVKYTGALSALLAAVIACTQTDIKRVLAYSTMSQIGYMMFALGVAGYGAEQTAGFTASMFHLFTHAFFKSTLFLCAGAVIHLVHSNEMKDMGGLRKRMPVTHICFLTACLAIAAIPPFSGFFSKEEILLAAFRSDKLVYSVALITSALTAFYMFRLYFAVFWSSPARGTAGDGEHSMVMKMPLLVLAAGSLLAGFLPFSSLVTADGKPLPEHFSIMFSITPVLLALAGIWFAGVLYRRKNERPEKMAAALSGLYKTVHRKFYIDEMYIFITRKLLFRVVGRGAAWIDKNIVDGAMNGLATVTANVSSSIKGLQSGRLQSYTLYFFAGVAGLAIIFIYLWGV